MLPEAPSFPSTHGIQTKRDTILIEQIYTIATLEAYARGTWQILLLVLNLTYGVPR
jgi:hypothetical protein